MGVDPVCVAPGKVLAVGELAAAGGVYAVWNAPAARSKTASEAAAGPFCAYPVTRTPR